MSLRKGDVLLRMEQSGFRPKDEPNYQGAYCGCSDISADWNGRPRGCSENETGLGSPDLVTKPEPRVALGSL